MTGGVVTVEIVGASVIPGDTVVVTGEAVTAGAVVSTGESVATGALVGTVNGAEGIDDGTSDGRAVATLFCDCKNRVQNSPSDSAAPTECIPLKPLL